jgi:CBS domain-containing protein
MCGMAPTATTGTGIQLQEDARPRVAARVRHFAARNRSVVVGAVLLAVGVGLVALVAKLLDLTNGSVLVVAFLGPLLAYLILTEQLSELGAGGLNLKFREAARKPVEASVQRVIAEETQTIEKLGVEEMTRIDALDPEAPVVLTLTLAPRSGEYVFDALQQYLVQLGRHPRFRFVVLLDHDGRVVGYLPRDVAARQLETLTTAKPLLDAVNAGRLPRDRGVRTDFLTPESTTEDALSRMTALRVDAMLVRNDEGKLLGITERDEVLARLMLSVARS